MAVCGVIQADVKHNKIIAVNKEALQLLGTDAAALKRSYLAGKPKKVFRI